MVRVLLDTDSGNGSGGNGAGEQPGTGADWGANPQGWAQPGNQNPPAGGGQKPKDPEAGNRYAISRERELRVKAETRAKELEEALKKGPPQFNAENDPDGTKERDHLIATKAQELVAQQMKELGLEDTLNAIKYEKEQATFFEVVTQAAQEFKTLWIEPPTKDEMKTLLLTIDEKGITPEQVIMLSKAQDIIQRLKPGGFTPWAGGKPNPAETPKTQKEINEEIFKRTWAFGR